MRSNTSNLHQMIAALGVSLAASIAYHQFLKTRRRKKKRSKSISLEAPPMSSTSSSLSKGPVRLVIDLSNVILVTTEDEWNQIWPHFKEEVYKTKVLGLDCEWVSQPCRGAVALLQMATSFGMVVMVRLFMLDDIPPTLHQVLADKSIIKTGVQVFDDGKKLTSDYGLLLSGCVDLRHLALRVKKIKGTHGYGLKGLSWAVLGVKLDKTDHTARSNWEAQPLSQTQLLYAAADALAGIFIFHSLISLKKGATSKTAGQTEGMNSSQFSEHEFYQLVTSCCQGIIDIPFSGKNAVQQSNGGARPKSGGESSDQQRRIRSYMPRNRPLYQNCRLLAPDDQLLCTCDERKATWYVDKGLADKVSDDPLTVKLKFEPSGRPREGYRNYYTQDKLNICVVCGSDDSYIRKNIVPHEYRKCFPPLMKEHRSHDVLLVCLQCHQRSNTLDTAVKMDLARRCDAPMGSVRGVKYKRDPQLSKLQSAAKALKNSGDKLPAARKEELEQIVRDYFGVDTVDLFLLEKALAIDNLIPNEEFVPHGEKVVQYMIEHEGLVNFEKMWREHFIKTMNPQHLPDLWSVEHHHDELENLNSNLQEYISAGN